MKTETGIHEVMEKNDDRTVAVGGKGMILAGRYHILRQLGQGGMNGACLEMV